MTLTFENEQDFDLGFDPEEVAAAVINGVLDQEACPYEAEVELILTDPENIRTMNREHRNIDRETDVLSFPMGENGVYDINPENGAQILGDVVISMEKAAEQADRYGHTLQREVGYLTAHSVLHLLGYDHENNGLERVRMREKEELVMTQLGLPSTSSYVMNEDEE